MVSPTGIAGTAVVSRVGTVHQGGGGTFGNANSVGYMKASPDGSLLGVATRDAGLELFNFNNSTGQVSNARQLYTGSTFDRTYGVAFSPDNTKLYTTDLANGIYQYNLSSATPASTRQNIGSLFGYPTSALQLGPDGRIYVALLQSPTMGVIANPNALGLACGYTTGSVVAGGLCQVGLPNFPNSFSQQITTATVSAPAVCVGAASSFSVALSPVTPVATHVWNFGDPSSGAANTGTGATPTHTYAAAGTYTVTVTTTLPGNASPIITTQTVTVNQLPVVSIGAPAQSICPGQTLVLTTSTQPTGSTFRWQDASTGTSLVVTQPGIYSVTVTSPQGCSAQATTTISLQAAPTVRLGADTTACLSAPLVLRANAQPAGATYRWQDNSTNSTFMVQAAGTYAVEVTLSGGCTGRDEIVVRDAQCPFKIPNIITPNGDTKNDAFALKGLNPRNWSIEIYNRWGRRVYQTAAYDNSWNAAGQSAGIYYYMLHNAQTGQHYKGWVEVIR
ncbi:gliding motility-associated C-terminal domain-containing protein [Hymenobacter sp. BT186]|uniref:Gliding motility-associated C-terminal domain-containing protein n=1 Tax=Hymenobacter telluris TaxID=2816474 RepID=A0A939JBU4_9BACT|nr:gliding motility-associated C-terminal domain-containing protein [Hymenobacter telluris]MBO0356622.1 gliding motility-associated C-terminal domain-containing protein [Hymenobacter telluris]MBW3372647.1 gliding motility-associated C-terminal domain-containing protein [Hymenobacter norwichensis]